MVLFLIAACGSPAAPADDTSPADTDLEAADTDVADTDTGVDGGDSADTAGDDPSPYVLDDSGAVEQAMFDAGEVALGITAAFEATFALDPILLADAHDTIWAQRDEGCPAYDADYLLAYSRYSWNDDCVSESGAHFDGRAYFRGETATVYASYVYDRYLYLNTSSMLMTRADGQSLSAAGYAYYYDIDRSASGYVQSYLRLYGAFQWEGADYASAWFGSPPQMDLSISTTQYTAGSTYTSLDGSLSAISADITAVNFSSIWYENSTSNACAVEPGGTVRLRDSEGRWYEVTFDGPVRNGASSFPAWCDGCGAVWWRGEYLGEACPDFTRLLDWERRPWN
jgi:hypothetical protein